MKSNNINRAGFIICSFAFFCATLIEVAACNENKNTGVTPVVPIVERKVDGYYELHKIVFKKGIDASNSFYKNLGNRDPMTYYRAKMHAYSDVQYYISRQIDSLK